MNPTTAECSQYVGSDRGQRDGKNAQLSQPAGLCTDRKTLFVADTATGMLRMTSGVSGLVLYLNNLRKFALTFDLHLEKEKKLLYLNLNVAIY